MYTFNDAKLNKQLNKKVYGQNKASKFVVRGTVGRADDAAMPNNRAVTELHKVDICTTTWFATFLVDLSYWGLVLIVGWYTRNFTL